MYRFMLCSTALYHGPVPSTGIVRTGNLVIDLGLGDRQSRLGRHEKRSFGIPLVLHTVEAPPSVRYASKHWLKWVQEDFAGSDPQPDRAVATRGSTRCPDFPAAIPFSAPDEPVFRNDTP